MIQSEMTKLLKKSLLFSEFSEQEILSMTKTAKVRDYAAGSTIVKEGDIGGVGFYFVLEGQVEVRRKGKAIATMKQGEFFGEMALLLDKDTPRSADVVAASNTRCMVLTRWDLRSLIATHPDIAVKVMSALAQRLGQTHKALTE